MAVPIAQIPPPQAAGVLPGTQFAARGHSGANRVFDYGPGADTATVAADFGFADLLDVINPLQHIPLLGSVYREVTGDRISAPARILGDVLYGGPVGLAFGAIDVLFAEIGGQTPGDALVAALFGGGEAAEPGPALAEAPTDAARVAPDAAQAEPPVRPQASPLSGEAALQALAADILGRAAPLPKAAPPQGAPAENREAPERAFKIRARDWRPAGPLTPTPAPPAAPLRPAAQSDPASAAALQPSFAQRMMIALDKYEALARRSGEAPAGALLNRGL